MLLYLLIYSLRKTFRKRLAFLIPCSASSRAFSLDDLLVTHRTLYKKGSWSSRRAIAPPRSPVEPKTTTVRGPSEASKLEPQPILSMK